MNVMEYQAANKAEIKEAVNTAVTVIRADLDKFTDKFKVDGTTNNFYEPWDNTTWTSGFWTGQLWLAYEMTGDERFKEIGEKHVHSFLNRIKERIDVDHHDMGFLYSLSCVAAYKLVGSEEGKQAAILAADNLISRYQPKGDFIQAWGKMGADDNYRLIIDCLLNLPLLYWASEVTGDKKYEEIATKHIHTALKVVLREDNSTHHTYYFNKETGEPMYGVTHQGYSNTSAWSRGQAWGIYGTALSYRYVQRPEYLETFYKMTDFFIEHLPKDLVPYWDFEFTDGSDEPRDSSAAAIAVCGMLEMAKYLPADKAEYYTNVAMRILKSLIENYAVKSPTQSNGLLLHGVYVRKSPFNAGVNRNVDECNTWGDYFYLEALVRCCKDWELYW